MKIQSYTPVEENTIGDFKDIQSSIRVEDLGFALNAVSKNLYSNPIGSFVRELTSNAVDANTDNKSDKPVIVKSFEEDGLYYFSVQDYGIGMSEEIFTGVYMNWFNSNKRDNNTMIGGWGIGSKSPLSYVDNYEVLTINNGIEYNYQVYKAKDIPTATLLSKNETDKESGTTIKFEVKQTDLIKIYSECKKQLLYFHNVLVECYEHYYDNSYKILDSEHFRYRTNNSSLPALHISLGNVPYDINFSILGIKPIYIPIALKFQTGELPVVLSRESINYEDENYNVIKIIKDKIDIVTRDLVNRYTKQMKFTDLSEYIKHLYNDYNTQLDLAGYKLNIDKELVKDKKGFMYYNDIPLSLNKAMLSRIETLIFESFIIGKKKSINISIEDILIHPYRHRYIIKDANDNKYSNYAHKDKNCIKIKPKSKYLYLELAEQLKLRTRDEKISSWIYLTKSFYDDIIKIITNKRNGNYSYYSEDVKLHFKQKEKERNINITCYNARNNRVEETLEDLNSYKYLFYIVKDENIDFVKVAHYELLFNTFNNYFKKRMKLIVIPSSTVFKFKKRKHFYKAEEIFKLIPLRNHFNRLLITREIEKLNIDSNIFYISKYYNNLYSDLISLYNYNINVYTSVYKTNLKETRFMTIDIVNYFYEEFNKRRVKKHFKYIEYINELKSVSDFLKTFLFIYENKDKEYYKIAIKYLIKNSKLIKINRKFNG